MKTKKEILTEIHDEFKDRWIRKRFDEILKKEMPSEEKELEEKLDNAKAKVESMRGKPNIRISKIEKAEKEADAIERKFLKLRYQRIFETAKRLIEEGLDE